MSAWARRPRTLRIAPYCHRDKQGTPPRRLDLAVAAAPSRSRASAARRRMNGSIGVRKRGVWCCAARTSRCALLPSARRPSGAFWLIPLLMARVRRIRSRRGSLAPQIPAVRCPTDVSPSHRGPLLVVVALPGPWRHWHREPRTRWWCGVEARPLTQQCVRRDGAAQSRGACRLRRPPGGHTARLWEASPSASSPRHWL